MADISDQLKKPLIVLTGPTAVGKTKLSLDLAEAVNGSIISADSVQVYRGLDIGSDKLPVEERRGIPHYLIDVLDPDEEFNVWRFQQMAKEAMEAAGVTPQVAPIRGGTDGAQLSFRGLPCPNLFTGGANFHGRYEYLPIPSLVKACETVIEIAKRAAQHS